MDMYYSSARAHLRQFRVSRPESQVKMADDRGEGAAVLGAKCRQINQNPFGFHRVIFYITGVQ
jgi:hypothetical protein